MLSKFFKKTSSLLTLTLVLFFILLVSTPITKAAVTTDIIKPTLDTSDTFGNSVAVDGDVAIIGAKGDDDNGTSAGAAYIYRDIAGTWTLEDKIVPVDVDDNDYFGTAVDIQGNYAVITATGNDESGTNSGVAYVYFYNGATWGMQSKLIGSNIGAGDRYGHSISIDGDKVAVGAADSENSFGATYVFKRTGVTWAEEALLVASDAVAYDEFGDIR